MEKVSEKRARKRWMLLLLMGKNNDQQVIIDWITFENNKKKDSTSFSIGDYAVKVVFTMRRHKLMAVKRLVSIQKAAIIKVNKRIYVTTSIGNLPKVADKE